MRRCAATCRGNHYVTTLHSINSAVVKLGKLTKPTRVFRGISGARMPKAFTITSETGIRGGIEQAFTSTTKERDVAMAYASNKSGGGGGGGPGSGVLLEMQMGMIDRGADLTWLSQYPHEQEILFAPL